MAQTVVGLFDDYSDAQAAVDELVQAGVGQKDISIVASNAHDQFASGDSGKVEHRGVTGGVVKGAGEGAVVGGLTGFLASAALFLLPGIGPVAGAGALAATLSGAGLGALGGGAIGGLTRLGIPHGEAGLYAEGVRRGGTLVTVHAEDGMADKVVAIIDRHGPINIDQRADYYKSTGYTGFNETAPAYTADQIASERAAYSTYDTTPTTMASMTTTDTTAALPTTATSSTTSAATTSTVNAGESVAIPIVEEELQVGKRAVQRGGARIHTRVIETPVNEQVTLREEHVSVERTNVNRVATAEDLANAFTEGTIELTERGEEVIVSKQARVVGEVVVGKEATERTETVSDTVRRTDVDVEELDTTATATTTGTTTTPPRSNY